MPSTIPNSRLALAFALVAAVAAVAGALLVLDGVRARGIDAAGPRDGRSAAGGALEARAVVACRARAWVDCERLSQILVERRPIDGAGWLRLAEAKAGGQGGRLGPAGLDALSASYQVSPLGYERLIERFRFSLDHWEELPGGLRQRTRRQLRAGWIVGGPPYGRMRNYRTDGANPVARDLVKTWSREVEAAPLAYPDITRQGVQLR